MFNPFKKLKKTSSDFAVHPHTKENGNNKSKIKDKFFGVGVNMASRVAMKKMAKMSPKEQQNMMQEAMNPKNRDKMLQVMEMMRKTGQITEEQYKMAKEKLGL